VKGDVGHPNGGGPEKNRGSRLITAFGACEIVGLLQGGHMSL
jgi:hypothetical protein